MIHEHIDPDLLADNADKIHKELVTRYFTENEVTTYKNQLADCHLQVAQRTRLVATISDLLKEDNEDPLENIEGILQTFKMDGQDGTKTLKANIKSISEFLHTNSVDVTEDVFTFFHFEEGKAAVYNVTGNLMYTRPLKPDEKQTKLFNLKEGTNE